MVMPHCHRDKSKTFMCVLARDSARTSTLVQRVVPHRRETLGTKVPQREGFGLQPSRRPLQKSGM